MENENMMGNQELEMLENDSVEESELEDAENEQEEVEEKPLNKKELDFAAMRKAKMKAEQERDELLRLIQQQQKNVSPQQQDEDDDYNIDIDDESLVEGKHIKKMMQEVKHLKNELKNYHKEYGRTAQDTLDMKLRSQYPDIDKVLTPDNISMFKEMDPDLAETIGNTKDIYKQAKLAYKMIKQYGIYKEDNFVNEKEIAQKNSNKPKSLTSLNPQQGESPLSHANAFANGLTPELKKKLYREMQDIIKGG